MIKTPYDDLPNTLKDAFAVYVETDEYDLSPSTLYNNTVLTAQNSGISEASKRMDVPESIVSQVVDVNCD